MKAGNVQKEARYCGNKKLLVMSTEKQHKQTKNEERLYMRTHFPPRQPESCFLLQEEDSSEKCPDRNC